ncbi:hypothetical protein UA08_05880 [Talaromyces atroroseus]|uniref:Major facilitator superfamily (MFS) profile domain-containing protein n=1 Tax=Talaromyces atroroseus TaxID=1441469 RepID=A0A225AIM7_TALAT|nr:hypothetical protein UA08_05880 [Talaromyces atroroseus]OKL59193.1 hypothetical protein UA08_05880 [Talaromyces atroroseus]
MSTDDPKQPATVQKELKKPRFVSYLWDTFDKPPAERRLLTKLDTAIISFGAVGYFVKSVDQYNINNAFVSGILHGRWVMPWGKFLVISSSVGHDQDIGYRVLRCNHAYQFYVIRLLIGLCESGYYPGIQHSLGSWYRRDELGKRACIFQICSAMGQMASGYIMGAVYHLEGIGGFKGWQWAYIINGSIALPVAIAGYFILPDVPEITKSWYLSEEEIKLSQLRMHLEGRKPRSKYTKEKLKRIFSSWHIYLMSILYVAFNNGIANTQPIFQQYLRHSTNPRYSIPQINNYPTTTSGVQILMTVIYAWLSDTILQGRRWPPLVFGGIINIICYVSLAIWDIPTWWKWTCLIAAGASFGLGGLCMAWANEVCQNDSEERAITIAAMNEIAYILQIWLPLLVWQQVDAPRYFKGYVTVSSMSVLLIVMSFIVRRLHNREMSAETVGQQEHATESCVQLHPRAAMDDGDWNINSHAIQLCQFDSINGHEGVSSSSSSVSNEKYAPSPTTISGSTIAASPCEKGSSSILQSPATDSGEMGIEACPLKPV